jgi:hypothetical protein
VERDLREGSERARACWTAATARTPNLTGQVELGMGLYDHHAESVFVIANATGDAELPACLIDAMKAWPFPSVARETNVSWSFGPGGPVWATERGARVHTVSLTMRGGDDAPGGAVSASVRRYSGQLRYCYDQALKQAPELAGTLEVTWTLAGGKAERVQANGPGLDALATCVAAKVVRWTFPSDLEGDVRWTVRFALEP